MCERRWRGAKTADKQTSKQERQDGANLPADLGKAPGLQQPGRLLRLVGLPRPEGLGGAQPPLRTGGFRGLLGGSYISSGTTSQC